MVITRKGGKLGYMKECGWARAISLLKWVPYEMTLADTHKRAAAAMEPACVSPHAPHTRHGPTATDPRAACCVAVYIKNK